MEVNMLGQVLPSSAQLPLAKVNTSQGLTDSKLLFNTAMSINVYLLAVHDEQAHNAIHFPIPFFQNVPTWKKVFLCFLRHTAPTCIHATTKYACGTLQKTLSWAVKVVHKDRCLLCTAFTGNFSRSLCLQRALLEEREVRCGGMGGGSRDLFHPHPGAASLLQAPGVALKTQYT